MNTAEVEKKGLPVNAVTGQAYQGRNVEALVTGIWATFIQWRDLGYRVKKGEHGTKIIKFVEYTEKRKSDGKIVETSAPRMYTVFNEAQVEKIEK